MNKAIRFVIPVLLALLSFHAESVVRGDDAVSFSRQIRGILSDRCFACHGPDEAERQAGLRLDNEEAALAELDSGSRAIVPGDVGASELITRLTTDDPDLKMPPEEYSKTVSPKEVELIAQWIDQGAEWGRHWAFETITRPQTVDSDVSPIDGFINRRLEREGLTPGEEANRVALIRRVSLDLTGLPPTPAEADAFIADTESGAYGRLVDRLLASPRYGEHMARYWLDVARYGDTHGLHLDNYREIWAYRDWVVNAFNSNKPYDVFITEQLAGDLLPKPTQDQLIATGFNRCNVSTSEGGSIAEEVRVRNVVDRTVTAGTAFLALTMDCTRCHDHKFDPLTMKDFYSFSAYFNSIDGGPLDGNRKDHAPVIPVYTTEQHEELAHLKSEKIRAEAELQSFLSNTPFAEPTEPASRTHTEPQEYVWIEDDLPVRAKRGGITLSFSGDRQPVLSGKASARLDVLHFRDAHFLNAAAPLVIGANDDVLFAHVYIDPEEPPAGVALQFHAGDWEHRAYWGGDIVPHGTNNTPSRFPAGPLPKSGEWARLEVRASDIGLRPGDVIDGLSFAQHTGGVWWDRAGIVSHIDQSAWYDSQLAWEIDEVKYKVIGLPDDIGKALQKPAGERSAEETAAVRDYFLRYVWVPVEPYRTRLDELERGITAIEENVPTTLVFREKQEPTPAHILHRGEYDQQGEEVVRGVPAALPPLPADAPDNRLGLAQWLTAPDHPLTARVAVNRIWQQFFGTGLVKTSEDFGSQGEPPSHPELLDWLGAELMNPQQPGSNHPWDVKHLIRQIVMSDAYRRSATVTQEQHERDPTNRLFARGPRFRLDAETLRDQALFLSGLLCDKMGGPSVKPPQPEGLWKVVGFTGSDTEIFKADTGREAVHRRTLYTFVKRTAPPPQMSTFDAPSREACVVRRERSNSPMQALLLMNDPQYVECARGLAERVMNEAESTPESRAAFLLRQCLLRTPTDEEVASIVADFRQFAAEYSADEDTARALIAVGEQPAPKDVNPAELAAWTMMANLVLNLDEVLNK